MPGFTRFAIVLFIALLPLGCASTQPTGSSASFPLTIYDEDSGVWVPAGPGQRGQGATRLPQADLMAYQASGPFLISMDKLPSEAALPDLARMVEMREKGRIEKPIPEAAAEKLRAKALLLPPAAMAQRANEAVGPGPQAPTTGSGFDSLDYTECCGGGGNVPADSELAVGPNHIIAVVNVAFESYDKNGNSLQGPTTFSSFFSGTPNCSNVFDPNVIYDEKEDRFILGIDADGTDYCIAVSPKGTPFGTWDSYSFPTDVGGNFFDYPHAGVGNEAIYIGANMFGTSSFVEGRVWAVNKADLYGGALTLRIRSASTGTQSTPQPMNLHGWSDGSWPASGPHYILTDGPYDGARYGVWSWGDPFGVNTFVQKGLVNLNLATGVTAGMPVDAPQSGRRPKLDGNDWRVQDAEYRKGYIWMTNTIACNPGGGTVDCVRWAQIDPEDTPSPSVVDAGVYSSDGEYRIFADLAVDECENMAVGYTKTSSSMYPGVYVSGRESGDPLGTLQNEVQVKAGEIKYTSFQFGTTHRWGDYTAMTIDPDGKTFWYMGQYSKNTGTTNGRWGNFIAPFSFASCGGTPPPEPLAPGQATDPDPDGSTLVSISANLGWTAGSNAEKHNVYIGTAAQRANLPLVSFEQSGTSFNPDLTYDTTYYWRVDEVNTVGTQMGAEWSFKTEMQLPQPTLVPSSSNNGKTWTATVTGPVGQTLAGTWSPNTGTPSPSCVSNVCTMEQIPKKEAQVVFTQDGTGTEVTVLKP